MRGNRHPSKEHRKMQQVLSQLLSIIINCAGIWVCSCPSFSRALRVQKDRNIVCAVPASRVAKLWAMQRLRPFLTWPSSVAQGEPQKANKAGAIRHSLKKQLHLVRSKNNNYRGGFNLQAKILRGLRFVVCLRVSYLHQVEVFAK